MKILPVSPTTGMRNGHHPPRMDSEHIYNPTYGKFYRTINHSFLGDWVPNPLWTGCSSQRSVHSLLLSAGCGSDSRRTGIPVESLNIHMLCDSSSKGEWLWDSLNWLRRRAWEMGARRRPRLLSCTRVLRTLESRTEVCFGGGEEETGRKETVSGGLCVALFTRGVLRGAQGPCVKL